MQVFGRTGREAMQTQLENGSHSLHAVRQQHEQSLRGQNDNQVNLKWEDQMNLME